MQKAIDYLRSRIQEGVGVIDITKEFSNLMVVYLVFSGKVYKKTKRNLFGLAKDFTLAIFGPNVDDLAIIPGNLSRVKKIGLAALRLLKDDQNNRAILKILWKLYQGLPSVEDKMILVRGLQRMGYI